MYTPEQRRSLLDLARSAVAAAVGAGRRPVAPEADLIYEALRGAFVTLTEEGQLRGCIGYPEAVLPLGEAVIRAAASAATGDPRFPPVSRDELPHLQIEISVLSPLSPITPEEVEVGVHGLVIEQGGRRGLLLPQVPVEWGWDRETFLAHTCRKAGLPPDAWKKGARLEAFTAEVFHE